MKCNIACYAKHCTANATLTKTTIIQIINSYHLYLHTKGDVLIWMQKDCCIERLKNSHRNPHSTQIKKDKSDGLKFLLILHSSWFIVQGLMRFFLMHCPAYFYIWMQLMSPPSPVLQLLLSSLVEL